MTKLLDLSALSDDVEDNWTSDGEPTLDAVEALVGRKVSRAEVRKCGRIRYQSAPKPAAPPVDHQRVLLKAEERVTAIRIRAADVQTKLKAARAVYASAIEAWQRANPPPSPDEAYRQHLDRQVRHSVDGNVASTQPVQYRSQLDEVLANAGGRTTRNAAARKVRGLIR